MIYLLVKKEKLLRLYEEIRKCWYTSNDSSVGKYCEDLASQARMFTMGLCLSCYGNVISFTINAVVIWIKESQSKGNKTETNYHPPFELWYESKVINSLVFEIAFICQVIASIICTARIVGLDSTMMTLVLHIYGQFKLIPTWFRNISRNIGQILIKDNNGLSEKLKRDIIKRSIEHYQRMIIDVNEANDC